MKEYLVYVAALCLLPDILLFVNICSLYFWCYHLSQNSIMPSKTEKRKVYLKKFHSSKTGVENVQEGESTAKKRKTTGHALKCYGCVSSGSQSKCTVEKNCSEVFTMCKTIVFLPNMTDPFDGPESVVQDCSVQCKENSEVGPYRTISCCSTDLCNTRITLGKNIAAESTYMTLTTFAGIMIVVLQF